jgi:mRNA-degrading endonuclease toxin of MazEF toxin-antitoxin module
VRGNFACGNARSPAHRDRCADDHREPARPYRIPVTFAGKSGLILLDQIRTLDKIRLVRRLGAVTDKTLSDTLTTLQEVFAE